MALEYFKCPCIPYCEETQEKAKELKLQTLRLKDLVERDKLLSVHGREIVPDSILEKLDCFNIHPYLYCYKGSKPIKRAIDSGNRFASVGLHRMTREIDQGEVICEYFTKVDLDSEERVYEQLYPLYKAMFIRFEEVK